MSYFLFIVIIVLIIYIAGMNKRLTKQENIVKGLIQKMDAEQEVQPTIVQPNKDTNNVELKVTEAPIAESVEAATNIVEEVQVAKVEKKASASDEFYNRVRKSLVEWMTIEHIISTLGALLLVLGVGFIYKLAYDSGYITPMIVILTVYILGGFVLYLGNRVGKKGREVLSQVLFGGGIAILYITTFAANQNYNIIGGLLTFVFMCAITFLAFLIALSIDSISMSIIAIIGGLMTPFLVGISVLGLYGTGFYIIAIAVGSMAIFVVKKWRPLQYTTLIGVVFVTSTLAANGEFTQAESYQFGILLLVLYLLFFAVEFALYYIYNYSDRENLISFIVLTTLPIVTLAQVYGVLDLTLYEWGSVFTVLALKFGVLYHYVYRKKGSDLISNMLITYLAGFSVMAVILFSGEDIRYIGILIMALVYLFAGKRLQRKLINSLGLIIYGLGYVISLGYLFEYIIDDTLALNHILFYVGVTALLVLGALTQKGIYRKVTGGLALEGYALIALMAITYELFDNDFSGPVPFMILVFTGIGWLFYWLSKKLELLSLLSVLVMNLLPIFVYLTILAMTVIDDDVNWWFTGAFIIYGISLYIMTLIVDRYVKFVSAFRVVTYIIVAGLILVNGSVASGHVEIGLLLFGLFAYGLKYVEKDNTMVLLLRKIFLIGFMTIMGFYALIGVMEPEFVLISLGVDVLLLILIGVIVWEFKFDVQYRVIGHICAYLLITFKDFNELGGGAVTLAWAAYGIMALAYFVVKGKRKLANISLAMIILVAAKFIVIDLGNVEPIWRIVTSMAFGVGLLVLSYLIQPILKRDESSEKT